MFAKPDLNGAAFCRRDVLKMTFGAFVAASVPLLGMKSAAAMAAPKISGEWKVDLHHLHTGETYSATYRVGDKYLPDAFHNINHFLRDFRTGDIHQMDPHVLDVVSLVQARTRTGKPLQIISGYRCPKTNAMLHETTPGVAVNSMHLYGKAIDIRMEGFSSNKLRAIATGLKAGGVGYYPASDFVHVDTGRVRYW